MAIDIVLDASAVIVSRFIGRGALCAVNLTEVVARFIDLDGKETIVLDALQSLQLAVVPFDESQAVAAGFLRHQTRSLGLSLGDRACLAAAMALDVPVLTADRAWNELDLPVEIVAIR